MNLRIKMVGRDWASTVAENKLRVEYKIGEWSFASEESIKKGFGLFVTKRPDECLESIFSRLVLCETRVRMPDRPILLSPNAPLAGYQSLGNAEMWAAVRPIAEVTNGEYCYKVMQPGMISAFMAGAAEVQYGVGEVARAPEHLAQREMHLTAFNTKEAALDFASPSKLVFKAIGLRPHTVPERIVGVDYAETKRSTYETVGGYHWDWPDGTVMYEQIILTERIR